MTAAVLPTVGLKDAGASSRLSQAAAVKAAKSVLYRKHYGKRTVRCTRVGRGFHCQWSATQRRHLQVVRCRGTLAVLLVPGHQRPQVHLGPRRCSVVGKAPALLGFNEDPSVQSFALQPTTGILVRRIAINWKSVEVVPGVRDFTASDSVYRSVLKAGLRPLIVARDAPCWARPATPCLPNTQAPPDKRFDARWGVFVRQLVARYPRAVGLEIWNEPNVRPLFQPRVDPVRYAELLKEAYRAAKSVNPDMPVISAGLVAAPRSGDYGMADGEFLRKMYAAGAKGYLDGIGAHPYPYRVHLDGTGGPAVAAATEESLDRLRAARDGAGAPQTPLWVTETGVSTVPAAGTPVGVGATEAEQSATLLAVFAALQRDPDVAAVILHRLVDQFRNKPAEGVAAITVPFGVSPTISSESGFGIFRQDGTPKPAACALSQVAGGSLRC